MSWFTMPEELLYCETCKAHIEKATYEVTALVEKINTRGERTGQYLVGRRVYCARCEPDYDFAIAGEGLPYDDFRLNAQARTLVDGVSRERAADRQSAAVATAVQAALEAAAEAKGETPPVPPQPQAFPSWTVVEAAEAELEPAPPTRDPIT